MEKEKLEPEFYLSGITKENNIEYVEKIVKTLSLYGVCVIENFFDDEECDIYVQRSVNWLMELITPLYEAKDSVKPFKF